MATRKDIAGNKIVSAPVSFHITLWFYHWWEPSCYRYSRGKIPARARCDGQNDISMEDNARWLIQISNFPNDIAASRARRTGITILHCGQSRRTSRCTRFVDESSEQIAGICISWIFSCAYIAISRTLPRERSRSSANFTIKSYQYATVRTVYH